jgi:hypothetical protein
MADRSDTSGSGYDPPFGGVLTGDVAHETLSFDRIEGDPA